jgi:hypothetical protein
MTSSKLRVLALCTFAMMVTGPAFAQRSAADIETARQLYNQGVELRDRGDMKGALEKFRAAHALGNTPITGLELCKTYASLAQPVEAREVCLGVGRIPPLAGETPRSQEARNEAIRLAEEQRPKIATVRLRVTGVPQGREPTVTVDGAPVPLAALGELRAVDPGHHEVSARIGNGPETRSAIDLGPGESRDIVLPVTAPAPGTEPVPVVPPPGSGYHADGPPPKERSNGLAVAGFAIGGVGVGIGAITGIVALSGKSDLDEKCTQKICGREEHSDLDSAKKWGTVSTVAFIFGGIGVMVGLTATLLAPRSSAAIKPPPRAVAQKPTVSPDFGPGGVGLHGTF